MRPRAVASPTTLLTALIWISQIAALQAQSGRVWSNPVTSHIKVVPGPLNLGRYTQPYPVFFTGMPHDINVGSSSEKRPPPTPTPGIPVGGQAELPWTPCTNPPWTGTSFDGHPCLQAATTFPLAAAELYFTASGSGQSGHFDIDVDDGDIDVVRVNVALFHKAPWQNGDAKVERYQPQSGKHGLGFVTPRSFMGISFRQQVFFHVRVRFPSQRTSSNPPSIPRFTTNLPQFSHIVGRLEESVHFGYIALQTSNAPITIHALRAGNAQMKTSNAPIEAQSISSTASLVLSTSNASIDGFITLLDTRTGVVLDMNTSNSTISATIQLASTSGTAGAYQIRSTTSNGAQTLAFESELPSSALRLGATSSNAPVQVQLHSSFAGTFSMQTSNGPAHVNYATDAYDPVLGQRQISHETSGWMRNMARGTATWESGQIFGNVNIATSNAPVHLSL